MLHQIFTLIALLFTIKATTAVIPPSIPISPSSGGAQIAVTEARHTRKGFYVGGDYNKTSTGTILQNQIYVEQLTPAGGVSQPRPIILLHSGDISGVLWLNRPDGGRGWASFWLDRGYQVYIVDEWSVGRSATEADTARSVAPSIESVEQAFTAPKLYNKYYQARFHTQWLGNGSLGDPTFNDFYSKVSSPTIGPEAEKIMQSALCDLLQITGPANLIAHSLGSQYALLASDACPANVATHVSIEGDQTPFANYDGAAKGMNTSVPDRPYGLSNIPLTYDPPITASSQLRKQTIGTTSYTSGLLSNYSCILQASPARQLPNIAKAPMLFITSEASFHIMYDHCQVSYLQQAGVRVNYTRLGDLGIRGNGHFMMLEENSDQIALYVTRWIEQAVV